ncbi:MAG TPA: lantibiotic dehydratase [Candidatus Cybelea sp.]
MIEKEQMVRQALRIASKDLSDALDPWLRGELLQNRAAALRALAYVDRMASRSTPFGIFAGIGIIGTGEHDTLSIDEAARRTCTRADMGLISEMVAALETGAERGKISYITNEAAIARGDRLYVANIALTTAHNEGSEATTAQIPVSLKNTAAVQFVRELARAPRTRDDLAGALAERFGVAHEEAERVVERLIEAGVLISELRPSPVGDPIAYLRERLRVVDPKTGERLDEAIREAKSLDATPLFTRNAEQYRDVEKGFAALCEQSDERPVQIDMLAPFRGQLPVAVLIEIERLAEYLVRFSRVATMEAFRKRFEERYEGTERMVPLLELVDPNVGLGVPDPMGYEELKSSGTERDRVAMRLACEGTRAGLMEIELSEADLEELAPPIGSEPLPVTTEVGFGIAATSPDALTRGNFELTPAAFLATDGAARSLARFAHLFDANQQARIREVARLGLEEGAITAELSYVPSSARMYNVTIRPAFFDALLPVGVGGGGDGDTIAPSDLWVGIDRNRFFLWSRSRGRRVIPRESHLLNTGQSAPNLCKFLALVDSDGRRYLHNFDWGAALRLPYLPRVRAGKTILSLRRWCFARKEIGSSVQDTRRALERWRELWAMPRYIFLTERDNRLLIDLDSEIAAELVYDQIDTSNDAIAFQEALPDPERMWLEGASGHYAAEFVATLVRRSTVPSRPTPSTPVFVTPRRRFGPGSAWLYMKVYLGEQAFDDFLQRALVPQLHDLVRCGRVDRWFFLRYADPQSHLRVRLRAADKHESDVRERVGVAAEGWLREDRVQRYAFDTYDQSPKTNSWERGDRKRSSQAMRRGNLAAMHRLRQFHAIPHGGQLLPALTESADAQRLNAKIPLGASTALGNRVAEPGRDVAFVFQPIERAVERADS